MQEAITQGWFVAEDGSPDVAAIAATSAEVTEPALDVVAGATPAIEKITTGHGMWSGVLSSCIPKIRCCWKNIMLLNIRVQHCDLSCIPQ